MFVVFCIFLLIKDEICNFLSFTINRKDGVIQYSGGKMNMKNMKKTISKKLTVLVLAMILAFVPNISANAAVSPNQATAFELKADYKTTADAFAALSKQEQVTAEARSREALNALSDVHTIAKYDSWEFYSKSAPELRRLDMDVNMVSLIGYCDNDQVDNLVIYIRSTSGNGFQKTFLFKADGILTSYSCNIPADEYKIWIMGDVNIRKTNSTAYFSVGN